MISKGAPQSRHETVLLVEDNDSVRLLVRQVLQSAGYTVLEATNGQEAIGIAGRHAGAIPIVITDVVMPGMHGPDLVDQLLPNCPEMRVLFLSGYTENASRLKGARGPGTSFLGKPFLPSEILAAVCELLDR